MTKKKVLFFLPNSVGGAERVTITIAKMLDLQQYDVKFIIVGRKIGDIANFIPANYSRQLLHVYNIWDFTICKLIHLLKVEKPYAVFCSLRYLNARVLLATFLVKGIRTIVRNDNTLRTLSIANRFFVKLSYKKADVVIAQQEEMKCEILRELKLSDDKVFVISNPIDTNWIDKKVRGAESPYQGVLGVKYVCVGRIGRHKGQDILIKAFNLVHNDMKDSHLYLVGQYDKEDLYYKDLCALLAEYNINDHVHFVGYTDNPYIWMKFADCFVLSSRYEGLPNALIEAMYLGKPVVATKCIPVIQRIVSDTEDGILVPSEDYISMAKAMKSALHMKVKKMAYKPSGIDDFCKLF